MLGISRLLPGADMQKQNTRLQGAYNRVFFNKGASKEDMDLVLVDLAVFTRNFFQDGHETSLEEIHQNMGKRMVMSRILRFGFGENVDLSALYEASVAEQANLQRK